MPSIAVTIEAGCQVLPPRCRTWRSGTTIVPVRVEIAEATAVEAPILAVVETFWSDGSGREQTTYRAWQGRVFVEVELVDEHHTNRPPVTAAQYLGTEIRYARRDSSLQEEQARAAVAQNATEIGRRYLVIDGVLHRERLEPVILFDGHRWTVSSQYRCDSEDVYRLDEVEAMRARLGRFRSCGGLCATIDLRRADLLRCESRHARGVRLHLERAIKESNDADVRSFRTALKDLIECHDPAVLPAEVTVERLRALVAELDWFCTLTPEVRAGSTTTAA